MTKKCQIQISDETNCKITGLELTERKALTKKFEFMVPGARYLPSVRLGRWNGKTSFFSLGGTTYINLLPDIIPIIDDAGYEIELVDTRDYPTTFEFDHVTPETLKHKTWPKGHPAEGQPIVLRDYQIEVINNYLSTSQSVQQVATAAGKTICTAVLSLSVEPYGRSIVIVPNVNLVTQTEQDYINLGLDVGVYYGGRKEHGKKHTICTWQSLNILLKRLKDPEFTESMDEFFFDDVVCVIVDEVHMAKADVLKSMLTGVMSKIPIRWGLTGTIPKEPMDVTSLLVSIGPVTNYLSAVTLQDLGVLSKCHVNILQLQDNVDYRDYQTELKFLVSDDKRLTVIAKLIHDANTSGNTLVLIDRIEAGTLLTEKINEITPDIAVFVSGGTKNATRTEHYEEVATSSNKIILATYGVAAVGINIPRLFNVVLMEPGKSFVRTIQSIGRGLRKAPDKDFVQITDITSNCRFSKRHLTQRKAFYKEAEYPFQVSKVNYSR